MPDRQGPEPWQSISRGSRSHAPPPGETPQLSAVVRPRKRVMTPHSSSIPVEAIFNPNWWFRNYDISFDESFYLDRDKRVANDVAMRSHCCGLPGAIHMSACAASTWITAPRTKTFEPFSLLHANSSSDAPPGCPHESWHRAGVPRECGCLATTGPTSPPSHWFPLPTINGGVRRVFPS
jgi:hypothetical protein